MSKEIDVYVRLGSHDHERILTFDRPSEISDAEILGKKFAIDGTDVMISVEATASNMPGEAESLPDALHYCQVRLREWLKSHDYEVKFV